MCGVPTMFQSLLKAQCSQRRITINQAHIVFTPRESDSQLPCNSDHNQSHSHSKLIIHKRSPLPQNNLLTNDPLPQPTYTLPHLRRTSSTNISPRCLHILPQIQQASLLACSGGTSSTRSSDNTLCTTAACS